MESRRGRVEDRVEKEENLVEWQKRNIGEERVFLIKLMRGNKEIVVQGT